ncbi:MAG: alpha/beta hydrolase [Candidatus Binataceae bacterium]|nr:alpha/beta hydrolase [Candidatus Binataceae bacterium]
MPTNSESREPISSDLIVNGLRLHYLDWGGDGPPIIVLHATGFLGRIYRPIAEALRAIGHVYTYDQRGHGDSERAAGENYGWDITASDLEGFILAMGLTGVRGIGHSAGATAMGAIASGRPDLLARAMLIEPIIFDSSTPDLRRPGELRERTLKRKRTFDSVAAMFANFEHKPPYNTWRKEILRDYCEFGTRAIDGGRRELKCPPEVEARIYETSRAFDGLGYLDRCAAPLLVLFGEKSDAPGVLIADRVAAGAPHRRVVIVPDTTHFIPMEQPELIARMAVEFFGAGPGI